MSAPQLIDGGIHIDDRGEILFANDFTFDGVRRFLCLRNHQPGYVRAWHGHRAEEIYYFPLAGAAVVGVVEIDNWDAPSRDLPIHRFVLSAKKPAVLHIPGGCANGFTMLTSDAQLLMLSSATLEESARDIVRYDARYWDAWTVAER
jgi:dTDP-4-dehydrorhamnose 3,5-epimerase-like enzyme